MNYEKIKARLKNSSPQDFLTEVLNCSESDDFFTFSLTIDKDFKNNCAFLVSEETISETDLLDWKTKDFLVVAQTIDGDYVASMNRQTLIIPASLYKNDIEYSTLPLCDFFIAYYNGKITSNILPKIT